MIQELKQEGITFECSSKNKYLLLGYDRNIFLRSSDILQSNIANFLNYLMPSSGLVDFIIDPEKYLYNCAYYAMMLYQVRDKKTLYEDMIEETKLIHSYVLYLKGHDLKPVATQSLKFKDWLTKNKLINKELRNIVTLDEVLDLSQEFYDKYYSEISHKYYNNMFSNETKKEGLYLYGNDILYRNEKGKYYFLREKGSISDFVSFVEKEFIGSINEKELLVVDVEDDNDLLKRIRTYDEKS